MVCARPLEHPAQGHTSLGSFEAAEDHTGTRISGQLQQGHNPTHNKPERSRDNNFQSLLSKNNQETVSSQAVILSFELN